MPKITAKFIIEKNIKLQGTSCFLGVSMGPSYYAGDSLQAILDLVKQSNFGQHVVMFADALNAYNLMANNSELTLDKARELAIQQGDQWLASEDGKKLQIAVKWQKFVRWTDIIQHPDFSNCKAIIDTLYLEKEDRKKLEADSDKEEVKKQLSFSEAIDRTTGIRIKSIKASMKQENFDLQRIKPLIVDYLKEECAGELIIAKCFACEYELYPGERNSAATFIHKHYIKADILRWLTIKFVSAPKLTCANTLFYQPEQVSKLDSSSCDHEAMSIATLQFKFTELNTQLLTQFWQYLTILTKEVDEDQSGKKKCVQTKLNEFLKGIQLLVEKTKLETASSDKEQKEEISSDAINSQHNLTGSCYGY
jgi:hypothetical protein